jgi:hypothetical protein
MASLRLEYGDLEGAIVDLATEIDCLIAHARPVRQKAWRDPEKQLTANALDDMIHLLTQVKLRLHGDASLADSRPGIN